MSRTTRQSIQTESYPIYAFRQSGQLAWKLVVCEPNHFAIETLIRTHYPDLFDWHAPGLALSSMPLTEVGFHILGREYRNTFSGTRGPSWAWDDLAECWRAPDESIATPPHVETVESVNVVFAQPEYGWIDLTMNTSTQAVDWSLSEVYDPFRSELTSWLEAVIDRPQTRLFVNVEHVYARLDVIPAEAGVVILVAHSVAIEPEGKPLVVKMPRSAFVRDFYGALVAFWEGAELRSNWSSWLSGAEDWEPGEDTTGYWATEPWPIRSEKVERYLADNGALPELPPSGR